MRCVDTFCVEELNGYEDLRMWEGNDAVCREIVLVPSMLPIIIDCIAKVVQAIDKDFNQTTADHFTYNS